jgi:hypothetical protein
VNVPEDEAPNAVGAAPETEPVIEIERGSDISAEIKAEKRKKKDKAIAELKTKAEGFGKRFKHFFHKIGFAFRNNKKLRYISLGLLILLLIGGGLGLFFALRPAPPAKTILISFDRGDNIKIDPVRIQVGQNAFQMKDANGNPIMPTPLKIGSSFGGWSETALVNASGNRIALTTTAHFISDTTVYAIWRQNNRMAILSINDIQVGAVNIEASSGGLTALNLNDPVNGFIIPTDAYPMGEALIEGMILKNNYYDFLGWEYTDSYGKQGQLLFNRDIVSNINHTWDWVYDGRTTPILPAEGGITFLPPSYPTVLHAILAYRPVFIQFKEGQQGLVNSIGEGYFEAQLSKNTDDTYTLPSYGDFVNAVDSRGFSHWKIVVDGADEESQWEPGKFTYKSVANLYPAEKGAEFEYLKDKYYTAGEVISLNPLLHYLTSGSGGLHKVPVDNKELITIVFQAVTYSTQTFEMREFSETKSGGVSDTKPIPTSQATPIYRNNEFIYLLNDPNVQRYEFSYIDAVNSGGFVTATFPRQDKPLPVELGITYYFNSTNSVIIDVYYKTYERDVTAYFDYGEDAIFLGDIGFDCAAPVRQMDTRGGAIITMPSGESFVNATETFYGWTLADDPKTIYYTNSHFTVPRNVTELHFVAVWRDPALQFQFDLNGGDAKFWLPDTTSMKGDPGFTAHVTNDVPLRLGYDFVKWGVDLDGDGTMDEYYFAGQEIAVPDEIQFLVAQWTPKRVVLNFKYQPYFGNNLTPIRTIESPEIVSISNNLFVDDNKAVSPPIPEWLFSKDTLDFFPFFNFKGWTLNGAVYIPAGLEVRYEGMEGTEITFDEEGVNYLRDGDAVWYFTADMIAEILGYDNAIHISGPLTIDIMAYQPGKLVQVIYNIPAANTQGELYFPGTTSTGEQNLFDYYMPRLDHYTDHKPWKIVNGTDSEGNETYYQHKPIKAGFEFIGWTTDPPPWGVTPATNIPAVNIIDDSVSIPMDADGAVNIYAVFRLRRFTVEFRGSDNANDGRGTLLGAEDNNGGKYYSVASAFGTNIITLMNENPQITALGDGQYFFGWSTERDSPDSNPSMVYLLSKDRTIDLSDKDTANDRTPYTINIERTNFSSNPDFMVDADGDGINDGAGIFHLVFYAVHATSAITISYEMGEGATYTPQTFSVPGVTGDYAQNTAIGYFYNAPIYLNDRLSSQVGGSTIGPKSADGRDIISGWSATDIDDAINRKDFIEYGVMVGDDAYFSREGYNFVGWEAINDSNVSIFETKFPAGKIWFPGEYLPSFSFNVKFRAIWAVKNQLKQDASAVLSANHSGGGNYSAFNYKILSMLDNMIGTNITVDDGEKLIIAVPRSYASSSLLKASIHVTENGSGEVARILLPSSGKFVLAAGAIIAKSLKEIYISDNLEGPASPVISNIIGIDEDGRNDDDITRFTVGGELRRYVVNKGIIALIGSSSRPTTSLLQTRKYYYVVPQTNTSERAVTNSLISKEVDNLALIAVPSGLGVNFIIKDNIVTGSTIIKKVKSYAFTNMKNNIILNFNDVTFQNGEMPTSNLIIEEYAIYHSNIGGIVFPSKVEQPTGASANISSNCISGFHPYLTTVNFANDAFGNFAFLENKILYYGNPNPENNINKIHIMYVLPSVDRVENTVQSGGVGSEEFPFVNARGSGDNAVITLWIPTSVTKINDYAFSCINYTDNSEGRNAIESITIEGEANINEDRGGLTFKIFGITTNKYSSPFMTLEMLTGGGDIRSTWTPWQVFPIFVNESTLDYYATSEINSNEVVPGYENATSGVLGETLFHTQTFEKIIYIQKFKGDPNEEGNVYRKWITIEYGQVMTFFNPEKEEQYAVDFYNPFHEFAEWGVTEFAPEQFSNSNQYLTDKAYVSNKKFKIGMRNELSYGLLDGTIYINSSITLFAQWDEYPIQFIIIDPLNPIAVDGEDKPQLQWKELDTDFILQADQTSTARYVTLSALALNGANNFEVNNVYLPGLPDSKYTFIKDGVTYRFIGWQQVSVDKMADYKNKTYLGGVYLWPEAFEKNGEVNADIRRFPDGNVSAEVITLDTNNHKRKVDDFGIEYKPLLYFALYEPSTSNYHIEENESIAGTLKVSYSIGTLETDIRIPYARYGEYKDDNYPNISGVGYMTPIIEIAEGAFAYSENITGEIYIGGAILTIGKNAFRGTNATKLTFKHELSNALVTRLMGSNNVGHGLYIESGAFAHSVELSGTVTLPYITEKIGDTAFINNYKLEELIMLPNESMVYKLATVGDRAFAYNVEMVWNDVGRPEIINNVVNFGSGVFMGSGKIMNVIVRNYYNDNNEWVNTLIHAGQTNGANKIAFVSITVPITDAALPAGHFTGAESEKVKIGVIMIEVDNSGTAAWEILLDEEDKYILVDTIASNAFAFAEIVNYIKIGSNVTVQNDAFFMLGEQLQYIDLTDANRSNISVNAADHAFNAMSFCPLYVKDSELTAWKSQFATTGADGEGIDHWFRSAAEMLGLSVFPQETPNTGGEGVWFPPPS